LCKNLSLLATTALLKDSLQAMALPPLNKTEQGIYFFNKDIKIILYSSISLMKITRSKIFDGTFYNQCLIVSLEKLNKLG
jgi:hypothetical protein